MTGMLTVSLRNRIAKQGNFEFQLKNILVNGSRRGCSGFIKNLDNGTIVYVNTEPSVYGPLSNKVLYRTARDFKDYTGGRNHHGSVNNDIFIDEIVELLKR